MKQRKEPVGSVKLSAVFSRYCRMFSPKGKTSEKTENRLKEEEIPQEETLCMKVPPTAAHSTFPI